MQKLCRFREYACWRLSAFAGSKNHVGQSVRGGFVQHFSATSVSIHLPHKERKNLFSVAVKSDQRSGLRATSTESALIFSDQSVGGWNLFSFHLYLSSPLINFAGCDLHSSSSKLSLSLISARDFCKWFVCLPLSPSHLTFSLNILVADFLSSHDRKKLFKEKKCLCPNNQGGKCHFGWFFGVRPIFRPKTTFRPNVKTPVSP